MLEARTFEDARRLAIRDRIEALIAEVRETHPAVPLHALPLYLPEPARSRLVALLEETNEWIPVPMERKNDNPRNIRRIPMAKAIAKLPTGEEIPVLTRRLQGVPLDNWTRADFEEEKGAWARKCERSRRDAESKAWLLRICEPLFAVHPNATIGEVVQMLPEPQRSRGIEILEMPVRMEDLPIEYSNREPWHERIERAVVARLEGSDENGFSITDVLNDALIFESSPEWAAGMEYATGLLDAACGGAIEHLFGTGV